MGVGIADTLTPKPIIMLGWFNYYIIQWFFFRICREKIRQIDKVKLVDVCMDQFGECAPGYQIEESTEYTRYGILCGPLPASGWDARPYIWLFGKARFIWLFKVKHHGDK